MPLPRVIPRETSKEGAWYRHRKQPTSKDLPNSAPFFRWLRSSPSSNENESDIEREQLLFVKNIAAGNSQVRKRLRRRSGCAKRPSIARLLSWLRNGKPGVSIRCLLAFSAFATTKQSAGFVPSHPLNLSSFNWMARN